MCVDASLFARLCGCVLCVGMRAWVQTRARVRACVCACVRVRVMCVRCVKVRSSTPYIPVDVTVPVQYLFLVLAVCLSLELVVSAERHATVDGALQFRAGDVGGMKVGRVRRFALLEVNIVCVCVVCLFARARV